MAISPPSDLLLDVANAADPGKVRAATERLAKLAADPTASNEAFSKALSTARGEAQVGANQVGANQVAAKAALPAPAASVQAAPAPVSFNVVRASATHPNDPYQKFEAVLLQNFVESILPKDDQLFGDKTSAGVYRSMMAEQFASQLAKAGGIGIAKAVANAHPGQPARAVDEA